MSCEYCEHESGAYSYHKNELNHDIYGRVAKVLPCDYEDAEPMISWVEHCNLLSGKHDVIPYICVDAYDMYGEEICISLPINFCPVCGRELPRKDLKGNPLRLNEVSA